LRPRWHWPSQRDPEAERRAERTSGTFKELSELYVERHAKKKNKSWQQADYLVKRHLLPKWGKLKANNITRADVRSTISKIDAPVLAKPGVGCRIGDLQLGCQAGNRP
jgi:hypothetical protein